MPTATIPATDLPAAAQNWTELQRNAYHKLDYYLAATSVPLFKQRLLWQKLLKPRKWTPNQGSVLKTVTKVPSPNTRASFYPNPLSQLPKKDILTVPEIEEQAQLYWHYFDSPVFQFLPSFEDFLTDHIDAHNKDITEKIARAHDLFVRTAMLQSAPHIWVCGPNTLKTEVPFLQDYNLTKVKNEAFFKDILQTVTGTLDLKTIARLATAAEYDVGIQFYSGDILGDGNDGKGLRGKYCLVCSSEVWYNFINDEFLQQNRPLDMNIVTEGFEGQLFGRIVTKFEQYPYRLNADGQEVAPEIIYNSPGKPMHGMPVPNPDYVNAPYELAWLIGEGVAQSISVGPPPAPFSSGSMDMDKFRAMDWNGKVTLTRNILVPSLDENNNVVYEPNMRGEYVKLISSAVFGYISVNRRNAIPVLFKRRR